MPVATRQRTVTLNKWYLDVISPDGTAAVAYWADLKWGPFRAAYSSLLHMSEGGRVQSTSTARRGDEPDLEGTIRWSSQRLGLSARLEPITPPVEQTLLKTEEGEVRWRCHAPRARAVFQTSNGPIEGWGYAEQLSLTIRPWRLPIDELRWGRCLSDDAGIVWIEWRGPEPRRLVFVDGIEAAGPSISDDRLTWRAGLLTLDPGRTLRRGLLGSTVLSRRPFLRAITPRSIRALQEHKTVSRGRIAINGRAPSSGWAIHEVVRFGSH